ncbi:hypothetical protein AB7645_01165 [Bradyrhizobium sp. 956_D2_N1_5]|jgi:hypothetical protein|uniref:hypothetical protein n=1 Tax=unclassified Bradyrhizobium TaxID=2631580 RepID=UPI003F2347C4
MRKASPAPAGKFRDIVARIGAAFRAQREIDAKRALRRYSHLLEQSHETSRLNEMIPVCNEDTFENANRVDPRERAAGRTRFERA